MKTSLFLYSYIFLEQLMEGNHSDKQKNFTLSDLMKKLPKQEIIIIMGDFITKIYKGREGKHIEPHGLGVRKENLSVFASVT